MGRHEGRVGERLYLGCGAHSLLVVAAIDQQHIELGAQIGIHCGWCVCSCRPRYLEFSGWWSQGVL